MRVALSVGSVAASDGGPSRSVPALSEALAREGVSMRLLTCSPSAQGADSLCLPASDIVRTHVAFCDPYSRLQLTARRFRDVLRSVVVNDGVQLLHDNGVWLPTNHAVAATARYFRLPFIVSPRGMLEPWSLGYRAVKKRVAWLLYQRRDLAAATVLHATSEMEAENLRALGLRQPIAVIPNGVELPVSVRRESSGGERTALFLSRIHPKKGLLNLVTAWAAVRPPGWRVVIAGSDELGHTAEVEAAARAAGLEKIFSFIGLAVGERKRQLFATADLFVLPSYSENFGIVVAEALAAGTPVITTTATPWEELHTERCGWWIEPTAGALTTALREAVGLSESERAAMGARGRELVRRRYTWSGIAKRWRAVYEWTVGGGSGPAPEAIELG